MKTTLIIITLIFGSFVLAAGNGSGTLGLVTQTEAVKYVLEDRGQIEFQYKDASNQVSYIKARAEEFSLDQSALEAIRSSKSSQQWEAIK